jgi:hypothetical protein
MKHSLTTLFLLTVLAGCAHVDRMARAATQPENRDSTGLIASIVTGNPITGNMIENLVFISAAAWLYIRKGKYKTALRTVVNTVEPFIPEDEPAREKLKEAQGPTTTALVKKAKA